jgi:hypothetical protein
VLTARSTAEEQVAQPFEWKFTRDDLDRLLEELDFRSGHIPPSLRDRTCEGDD